MPKKEVVFISGPYRGDVKKNIAHARAASVRLWKAGFVPLCPHLNSANMDGECPDEVFLEGDLELLRRCDSIYMLEGWHRSSGSKAEWDESVTRRMMHYYEGRANDPAPPESLR